MESHALAKFTSSAVKPPVAAGTNIYRPLYERTGKESCPNNQQDAAKNDSIEVKQYEPENFKPVSNVERSGLQSLTVNRDTLTANFYGKVQALKQEHQKTLTLLNKFYETEKAKCHSSLQAYDNNTKRKINHLIPDYLDYTENNTLLHDNFPSKEPDIVPGYSRREIQEKQDAEKRYVSPPPEDSDEEQYSEFGSVDRVNRMWDDFSLKDYLEKGKTQERKYAEFTSRPRSAPVKTVKKKEWKPIITIPKPFNMTLREEQKSGKSHTRSSMEVSLRQKYKQEEEEKEQQKRIRAQETPAHTFLPLYEEMCERREQRSRFNKENSIATTMALQKPFSFAERDASVAEVKKQKLKEEEERKLNKIKRKCMFEAQPVPYSVHDPAVSDRLMEEEYYRRIKIKMRAEDTMRESALPPRMHAHELMARERREAWQRDVEKHTTYSFKPQTHGLPDFVALHRQEDLETMTRKPELETTVVKPFNLSTTTKSQERRKAREKEKKALKESTESEKSFSLMHSPGTIPGSSDTLPTRMTDSSRLRIENMRRSLQEADKVIARAKDEEKDRNERKKTLAQRVKEKAALNDSSVSYAEAKDEKLRQYKKQLRERQTRYNKFLDEVKQRVDGRPLLFEQHNERVAKQQAEKRYREILESSGLSDEFVENKSRLSTTSDDFEPLSSKDLLSSKESYDAGSASDSSEENIEKTSSVEETIPDSSERPKHSYRSEAQSTDNNDSEPEVLNTSEYIEKHSKNFPNKDRPEWKKYWQQTPQPRDYHYRILQRKYFPFT